MDINQFHSNKNHHQYSPKGYKKPSIILTQNITRLSLKYSTTSQSEPISIIKLAISNKKCRLREIMKDLIFCQQSQHLGKYYSQKQSKTQISDLTEYYKYYTQTSILYQQKYFKLMHLNRQKKKQVEYNRLKILLNLSNEGNNSSFHNQQYKNHNFQNTSFYILSKITLTINEDESKVLQKLSNKLQKNMGPNCYKTIEQLDKNYNFIKKRDINTINTIRFKKITLSTLNSKQKQNYLQKSKRQYYKRNSCQQEKNISKYKNNKKSFHKKKQVSMDNIHNIIKDYNIKQKKIKLQQENIIKKNQNKIISKIKQKNIQQNIKTIQIKQRINQTKQRIKKQKINLKKSQNTSQFQSTKISKKTTFFQNSTTDNKLKTIKSFKNTINQH